MPRQGRSQSSQILVGLHNRTRTSLLQKLVIYFPNFSSITSLTEELSKVAITDPTTTHTDREQSFTLQEDWQTRKIDQGKRCTQILKSFLDLLEPTTRLRKRCQTWRMEDHHSERRKTSNQTRGNSPNQFTKESPKYSLTLTRKNASISYFEAQYSNPSSQYQGLPDWIPQVMPHLRL